MLRVFARFLALIAIALLFVFAPEILTAVSTPYTVTAPRRELLRIGFVGVDDADQKSTIKTLRDFQKKHPSLHLRIRSVETDDLGDILPGLDVYFYYRNAVSQGDSGNRILCLSFSPYAQQSGLIRMLATELNANSDGILSCTPPTYGVQ